MSSRIDDLEPVTRGLCVAFMAACEEQMLPPVRVTHTLRTHDEQENLYRKGREQTENGYIVVDKKAVVTNARPGESAHNFAAAFDICVQGPVPYPNDDKLWQAYGEVGERLGLTWGGRWKGIVDRPHFERPDWRTLRGSAA